MQGIGYSGDGVAEKTTQGCWQIWTLATVGSPHLPSIRETKRPGWYNWSPGAGDQPDGDQRHRGAAAAAGHTAQDREGEGELLWPLPTFRESSPVPSIGLTQREG